MLLLMALALAGLWMRTKFVVDQVSFSFGDRAQVLVSVRSGLCWASMDSAAAGPVPWNWHSQSEEMLVSTHGDVSLPELIGEAEAESPELRFGYLFYWWLVLPLTLLSAYLILWKPRKKASQIIGQTI